MNVSNPPGPVGTAQPYLIAYSTGIDANSLATTTLNWQGANTATNTMPLFARVTRVTGTISLLVASLRLNSTIVQPITALQAALLGAASDPLNYVLNSATSVTVIPASGNWDVVVGTINGTAATISVAIYGFRIS